MEGNEILGLDFSISVEAYRERGVKVTFVAPRSDNNGTAFHVLLSAVPKRTGPCRGACFLAPHPFSVHILFFYVSY
jgi:hypothetical protein